MSRPSTGPARGLLGLVVLAVLIALVALPTFAADPSGSPGASEAPTDTATPTETSAPTATVAPTPEPTATAAPAATAAPVETNEPAETTEPSDGSQKSPKPDKAPKADKAPAVDVTVTGTVGTRTDADGDTEYTLAAGAALLVLDGGPSWFYGDNHPLKPYVGKRVTIAGSQRVGDTEVDVATVDGTRIRAEGKPAWAGGWKRVGERHPGWTQEKWDRWQEKAAAKAAKAAARGVDCFPPGQCKNKANKGGAASDDMTGADAGG